MVANDLDRAGTGGAGGLDVIKGADLGRRSLGDAAHRRNEHQGQGQHAVADAAAHCTGDRHGEQHRWKGVEHIHRPHDRGIDAPADETTDNPERAADHRGDQHRHHPHQQ